jgi:hypothetical protein
MALEKGKATNNWWFKGASVRLFKLAEAHNYLFGVPLRQRDPFNVLYFHFDVIAFDHDFVTWNAFLRWRPQNSTGFQVEIRTVPRTGDPGALNVAFRQRSATVRAGVADGMVSSLHIEEGYFLAFDCERSRLAGWHVLGLSYLEKFCHNA